MPEPLPFAARPHQIRLTELVIITLSIVHFDLRLNHTDAVCCSYDLPTSSVASVDLIVFFYFTYEPGFYCYYLYHIGSVKSFYDFMRTQSVLL